MMTICVLSGRSQHNLSRHAFFCTLVCIAWMSSAVSNAVRITSTGAQTVQVAEHDDIQISCTYKLESSDSGSLDIEWSIMSPDTTKQDRIILTYVHDQMFEYPSPVSGRFGFIDPDPSNGNASVRIRDLRTSDTNTFQCKVKKAPGIDTRKVTVGVHVRPQKPECWIDRSGDRDQDVRLHCVSRSGSPPLIYSWERVSGSSLGLPPSSTANKASGTLLIRNSTVQSYGTYRCSVKNLVGEEECVLILSAATGASKTGMIVGAILGALLALLLLLLLLWLICCCCRRRHQEKDRSHDIREDAAPPVSRSPSVRSVRSYKAHQARKAQHVAFYNAVHTADSLRTPSPDQSTLSNRIPEASSGDSKPFFVV